jgi:8-oxo-dGTP diphosphatase
MIEKHKAFAYITNGNRLLVFEQPQFPEAGIQVPAGTLKPDESPEAGVMREAFEETGLTNLTLVEFLGDVKRDMSDYGLAEIHHRFCFHLRCEGEPPDTWLHLEMYREHDLADPIEFQFYWVPLPNGVPRLISENDRWVPKLCKRMGLTS